MRVSSLVVVALLASFSAATAKAQPGSSPHVDPLPSWNETARKQALIDFVNRVTDRDGDNYVPPAQRIAVFDNDGTLWPEAPLPFQVEFVFEELKRRAPQEPKLAADPMVQAALAGDVKKLLAGKHYDGLMRILALTHTGITTDEFNARVETWRKTTRHPRFQKAYTDLTYQPMQELLKYLRDNGFETFIVSGGGADFMRVWSEAVYGIPPQNVVGSTALTKFEFRDGKPVLIKTMDQVFVDDKDGKPVGIHQFIGRRPIACFGNSDGDQAMLEYTTIGNPLPSFGMLVHHTDAEREYAYDAHPPASGTLVTALAAAPANGWNVVDMKTDWNQIWETDKMESTQTFSEALVGNWLAEDIENHGVVDRAQTTLEIADDGTAAGNTSVNRYSGKAKIDGDKIELGRLVMTRRAGPQSLMDQETRFMAALAKVTRYRIGDDGLLYLLDAEGNEIVRFSKIED
ncbi:META domain-containing protein [Rosistilla oblonga]|uniref:META domain-containing protein n=1 Tax=Rosistilla oblonga TaxID=2527990 RepID=UPI003A96EBA4